MDKFLVTRLIGDKSIVLPESKGYGDVEIRPGSFDFPSETPLLKRSCEAFEEKASLELAQRITVITEAESPFEADENAEVKFEQVLDCVDRGTFGLAQTPLLSAGFIKNLVTGWESPRLPAPSFGPFPIFARFNRDIQTVDEHQALFAFSESELRLAIFRSNHWLRRARLETILQLRCLFRWFALETLAKVEEENITGKLMQAIGFPYGRIGQFVSREALDTIKNHINYEYGKRYFESIFDEIRDYRNNIVHSGFRQWDVSRKRLFEYEHVLTITVPRLQGYAITGLYQGMQSTNELWEYFPVIFSEKEDFTTDLHGNILFQIGQQQGINNKEHKRIIFNI
ncbi:MAG: hypothetical protein PHI24_14015 [Desulfitobacteriaceae bacterium]|nr:hypothetical protein [Desulfitobacteriaceae bacterium]